ncbi:MAG: immunoglobulin domain-containing protein [Bacteroidia bacterium]
MEAVVSAQPQTVLVPTGDATFFIQASGRGPVSFRWQRDGQTIIGADSSRLVLPAVRSGSRSTVPLHRLQRRRLGHQHYALLRVTSNQRPVPRIESPGLQHHFYAGETIAFRGSAYDFEAGTLPEEALEWTNTWHHNNHTHPARQSTRGLPRGAGRCPWNS